MKEIHRFAVLHPRLGLLQRTIALWPKMSAQIFVETFRKRTMKSWPGYVLNGFKVVEVTVRMESNKAVKF